jgi:hypothetical protein
LYGVSEYITFCESRRCLRKIRGLQAVDHLDLGICKSRFICGTIAAAVNSLALVIFQEEEMKPSRQQAMNGL